MIFGPAFLFVTCEHVLVLDGLKEGYGKASFKGFSEAKIKSARVDSGGRSGYTIEMCFNSCCT